MSLKSLLAAAALSSLASFALADSSDLVVVDPYARASTPSSASGAIFLDVVNSGVVPDRLISASTPVAKMTMLHTHREDAEGVMRMVHVDGGWEVPADGVLMLERGGKHVMLMGLTEPLEQGDTLPLTLTFEQAGEVTVDVVIDHKRKPGGSHSGHSNDG